MSKERANTVVVIFLLILGVVRVFFESIWKGLLALITGKILPLKNARPLRLWHWWSIEGPKKFWKSPSMTKLGRLLSTIIQVVFYPQK